MFVRRTLHYLLLSVPTCLAPMSCASTVRPPSPVDGAVTSDAAEQWDDAHSGRPPRLIAPLSTSSLRTQTPEFEWRLPEDSDATLLEVCRDRACSRIEHSRRSSEARVRLSTPLTPGVHFWRTWSLRDSSRSVVPSNTWEFFVPGRSADTAGERAPRLDVNGDGVADAIFAVTRRATASSPLAYVFFGSTGGLLASPMELRPPSPEYVLQTSAVGVGDVNGDGYGDLLLGYQYSISPQNVAGRVFLYLGASSGVQASPWELRPPPVLYGFGRSASWLGDVDRDGYGDFGVYGAITPLTKGILYYRGGESPTAVAGTTGEDLPDISSWAVGDWSGTGRPILLATSIGAGASTSLIRIESGFASEVLGALSLPQEDRGILHLSADYNGDGRSDVLVQAGQRTLVAYSPTMSPSALSSEVQGRARWGEVAPRASDVDGDGFEDTIANCIPEGVTTPGPHCLGVLRGGAQGIVSSEVLFRWEERAAGIRAQVVADVNGDGIDDLVSAITEQVPGRGADEQVFRGVRVYRGRRGFPYFEPFQEIMIPTTADQFFSTFAAVSREVRHEG